VGHRKAFPNITALQFYRPAQGALFGGGGSCERYKGRQCSPSFKIIFIVVQELLMRKYDFFCDNSYVYLRYARRVKEKA